MEGKGEEGGEEKRGGGGSGKEEGGGKSRGGEKEREENGGERREGRGREQRGRGRGREGPEGGGAEISRNIKAFPAAEQSTVTCVQHLSSHSFVGPGAAEGILKRGRLPGILGVGGCSQRALSPGRF